jgi:hypothetical protein
MIIVDIDVWNRKIRAYKPDIPTPLPNDDIHKVIFWNNVDPNRINKRTRTHGYLKGEALKRAHKIVDEFGTISRSGEYGSIEIDLQDFVADTAESS